MTIIDLLTSAEQRLDRAGIEGGRLDAEVILSHLLAIKRIDLYTQRNLEVSGEICGLFVRSIEQREQGCPVAYMTGVKEFWSIPLKVTPDVLIPRPETELVVERALSVSRDARRATRGGLTILDLCTGSGCIAAALAKELLDAHFVLTDLSNAAIEVAKANLLPLTEKVEFFIGDLFSPLEEGYQKKFDLITANPPYIASADMNTLPRSVREYEPPIALSGGERGLDFIFAIIQDAHRFLKNEGWFIMEVGQGQMREVVKRAEESGKYSNILVSKDLAGIDRVVSMYSRG